MRNWFTEEDVRTVWSCNLVRQILLFSIKSEKLVYRKDVWTVWSCHLVHQILLFSIKSEKLVCRRRCLNSLKLPFGSPNSSFWYQKWEIGLPKKMFEQFEVAIWFTKFFFLVSKVRNWFTEEDVRTVWSWIWWTEHESFQSYIELMLEYWNNIRII